VAEPTQFSVIASEAKQSIVPQERWIASSQALLAMTVVRFECVVDQGEF
jgi:hypothetical protein